MHKRHLWQLGVFLVTKLEHGEQVEPSKESGHFLECHPNSLFAIGLKSGTLLVTDIMQEGFSCFGAGAIKEGATMFRAPSIAPEALNRGAKSDCPAGRLDEVKY